MIVTSPAQVVVGTDLAELLMKNVREFEWRQPSGKSSHNGTCTYRIAGYVLRLDSIACTRSRARMM